MGGVERGRGGEWEGWKEGGVESGRGGVTLLLYKGTDEPVPLHQRNLVGFLTHLHDFNQTSKRQTTALQ